MKNILILGSSGQIGSHLKDFLIKKKYKILEFDILNSIEQDLRIQENIYFEKLIKKANFIFFLAFDVGGSKYLAKYQNTFNFINNNIKIMNTVFSKIKVHKKKFIFASSQMSNMQYSNYGILKNIGEKYTNTIGGLIVKFWNVYGIERDLSKSHVITDFILNALKNRTIRMLTSGHEARDFLYAEDCCRGLEIMMKNYNKLFSYKRPVDLTTGKYTKIINIAKIIQKIMRKKNIKIKILASIKKDQLQKNKKNYPDKFFFKFWKPKISLEKGITEVFNYYNK